MKSKQENKRILILCDAITPPLNTPRVRFLCDYLFSRGWYVRLCTEQYLPINFKHDYPIDEIPILHCKGFLKSFEWFIKWGLGLICDYKNRDFARQAIKKYQHENFDLVCCSTFHTFPLLAAQKLAQQKQIPLHVDLRDIAEQWSGFQYYRHNNKLLIPFLWWSREINIKRRNKILRKTQSISSVSPWHINFLKSFRKETHLIYNGFDEQIFYWNETPAPTFDIVYTGKWHSKEQQNPTLLFKALQLICKNNLLNTKSIRLVWYTDEKCQQRLKQMASRYDIESISYYHPYIENHKIPNLLRASSVLLVLTNSGTHGSMTTKFFEALGVEKPVLCVRSDEGCLADTIQKTNAGLAASTVEEVKNFIMEKYAEWEQNGFTHQPVNQEEKKKFSRQKQAKQFEEIFIHNIDKDGNKIR